MKISFMPGDGIGPEICAATRLVLEAVDRKYGFGFTYSEIDIGFTALRTYGSTFPEASFSKAKEADALILGPVSHLDYPPREQGGLNPSGELRKRLDLYANIRPARTREGLNSATGAEFDMVIYRENTEGFYADRCMYTGTGEVQVTEDVALAMRRITRHASMRIVDSAFAGAMQRRKKVTVVHKQNVLKVTDGLFLSCCRDVATRYPEVAYEELIIDAACAHFVRRPESFDVVCTTNMFGDILSDLASELSGSLGLAASLNAGDGVAMAQAQHGSATDIAGKGIANPASLIGSSGMLLGWLGNERQSAELAAAGQAILDALDATVADPATRTRDLGGALDTRNFAEAVVASLRNLP
ncbi:MAG TPA: isocitrate/isopropylmalate dehydrogenase family protein [Paracoccus sp. (in: a-proteobacteria)]|uniref:isocitrate/isopropylmalate dehydrogenase family protein n=1 Tax=uncultured Paracoccus sp. TaxID=189685 RepID=UPI00260CA976|nr:isocitrate/isopropylmalate dehydrogenase family protein [uncultured Paracoccus sp.]HMQ40429.1 isocitrate/isopropylmalate dehydrogenase family protein [Paracoccus sp. (in: a-proteobacteria)]HMR35621.1 isocitrate/isopropylmalate dehydrogenase family protein [Paracoccus sp. (in: a-proteobacteria)]